MHEVFVIQCADSRVNLFVNCVINFFCLDIGGVKLQNRCVFAYFVFAYSLEYFFLEVIFTRAGLYLADGESLGDINSGADADIIGAVSDQYYI